MKHVALFRTLSLSGALALLALAVPTTAYAHCDTMDGPVVRAAQHALESRNLSPVLIWVQAQDESEVRRAFAQTLEVRGLGKSAGPLADHHFFETVVRLHRAGEGEPYTGLKPAGSNPGRAVPAADRALASGSPVELQEVLGVAIRERLDRLYADAARQRAFAPDDVAAGRSYVAAYVRLLHFTEEIGSLTEAAGHSAEAGHGAAKPSR